MIPFLAALQFLLVTPAFVARPFTGREMGRSVGFYALVGLLFGGILALIDLGLGLVFPIPVRSALLLVFWVVLTGGLHLDGFLDSCDGLLGGFTPESRMEIMRDERVGAFGLAGGVLLFLILYSALSAISIDRWAVLILAPLLGRWGISLAVILFPYARQSGLGKDIKDNAGRVELILGTVTTAAAIVVVAVILHSAAPFIALLTAIIVFVCSIWFILRRIPGMTGDTYGAINMLVEAGALLAFVGSIWAG